MQVFLFANVIAISELELYNDQDRNGDIMNKEVRRAKFRLLGLLGQGHNIIAHIRGLPACTKVFKELAGRMIPMDNSTRWNSWYSMLVVMLDQKSQIEKYYNLYKGELQGDLLSCKD